MKVSSWQDVANAITEFCAPYDDADIEPSGEAKITRKGASSVLELRISWPPSEKPKSKKQ